MGRGWIGVDLDGTLAQYKTGDGIDSIGEPIPLMLARVKKWLEEGKTVKIVTARVARLWANPGSPEWQEGIRQYHMIQDYTLKHLGKRLEVTCMKDSSMIELWDDRAVQVIPNSGMTVLEYITEGQR